MPSQIRLSKATHQILRAMRRDRRRILARNKGATYERMIYVPGPDLDILHKKTFEGLLRHRLIVLAKRGLHMYEYSLTELGEVMADNRTAGMRRLREAKLASTHGHTVDPLDRLCVKCGRTLPELVADVDREEAAKCDRRLVKVVPPAPESHAFEVGNGGS